MLRTLNAGPAKKQRKLIGTMATLETWLNAATTFMLVFFIIATFPTQERLERLARELAQEAQLR